MLGEFWAKRRRFFLFPAVEALLKIHNQKTKKTCGVGRFRGVWWLDMRGFGSVWVCSGRLCGIRALVCAIFAAK